MAEKSETARIEAFCDGVFAIASGATMDVIMSVYPRHKLVAEKFIERGDIMGMGLFDGGGNMAIFKTRAAAEKLVKEDPFILEGLLKSFVIKNWNDNLLLG